MLQMFDLNCFSRKSTGNTTFWSDMKATGWPTNFGCQRLESPVFSQTGLYISFPPKRRLKNPWTISTHEKTQVSPVFFTVKGAFLPTATFFQSWWISWPNIIGSHRWGLTPMVRFSFLRMCSLCLKSVLDMRKSTLHEKITTLNWQVACKSLGDGSGFSNLFRVISLWQIPSLGLIFFGNLLGSSQDL